MENVIETTVNSQSNLFPSSAVHGMPTAVLCGGSGMHWFFRAAADAHVKSVAPGVTKTTPTDQIGPSFGSVIGASIESLYATLEGAAMDSIRRFENGDDADLPNGLRPLLVVVPVTDDGGSSRAIMDVIGGPAVGDLRNVVLMLARVTARAAHAPVRRDRRRNRQRAAAQNNSQEDTDGAATDADDFTSPSKRQCSSMCTPGKSSPTLEDINEVPPPMTPRGEAAVEYFAAPELYDSERFLHTVLKMRLDPDDESSARRQRDSLLTAFEKAEPLSGLASVGRAFDTFSTVVAHDAYTWKNASIGNIYIAGRMLQYLDEIAAEQPRLSTHVAVSHALELTALEMSRMLGVPPHITVVPASSWMQGPATTAIGDVLPRVMHEAAATVVQGSSNSTRLPLYQIGLDVGGGAPVAWGQTRLSYGTNGKVVKGESAVEAHPKIDMASAKIIYRVVESPHSPNVRGSDDPRHRTALRLGTDMPLVRNSVLFGCGSFLTSTLAVSTTASTLFGHHDAPTDAIVLLNAVCDRELAGYFDDRVASGPEQCTCERNLASQPTIRLLSSLRLMSPHVTRMRVVAYAEGSVFQPSVDAVSSYFAGESPGCAACQRALARAGVDRDTDMIRCRCAGTGYYHGASTFATVVNNFVHPATTSIAV